MHVILPNDRANFTDFTATQPNKNPGKYTDKHIYHKTVKYQHIWAHQCIGTTLKLWAHYVTKSNTVWLLDSDYITAMQESDFR